MKVDLHLHTVHSDGNWTPAELVERAVELKLDHIAVTDHDTTAGIDEAQAAARGRLEVIPGIEINTVFREGALAEDVHVLGYFIDKTDARLRRALKRQQEARQRLVEDTIVVLRQLGVTMTYADVEACAGRGSIGRPHISQAIVKAGGAKDVSEAYERFMVRGGAHFVSRDNISPAEAVEAIVGAGGVASVAHPGKSGNVEAIILKLKAHGLQAVEAYHRRHNVDLVKHYIRFANRNDLVVSGGSDCHGPWGEYPPSIGSISVPTEVVEKLRAIRGPSL